MNIAENLLDIKNLPSDKMQYLTDEGLKTTIIPAKA